jgi:serine/threonine protein kinase/Tol biopolymer transport system component
VDTAVWPMVTKTISHYEILEPIGEGGMGLVYRAVDTRLGRPAAVKLLRPDSAMSGERRKRFIHEARAASALNHPHIITIYDIGRDGEVDFIAMEYVAGPSLADLLGRRQLSIREAVKYAAQIADALAAAHAAGILHRDLKPANIMVTDRDSIKVLDFGLAKLTESLDGNSMDEPVTTGTAPADQPLQTVEGTILGTAAYMSPEQAEGKPADARSDVFSLGAVLYEMFTGRRAFRGDTKISTLAAVLSREPELPSRLVPELSRDLEKLIVRCLRKDPERRWQSMADLKVALEDLRDEINSRSLGEATASLPARRWMSGVVAGLALAAIGAVITGMWWQTTRTPPAARPQPFLTRLTSDVGWTDYPAISLDGKFLAYASDRSREGNLDIWVQQLPDGAPVRVTHHPADDRDPSFSADGSRIAFQSSRLGGGVYVIPTLGGEERLVAARGFSPRFSPDGNWIAYGVAEQGSGQIYVAPAAGGPATPVAAGFYRAQSPVWSPDSRYLLFWAQRQRTAPAEGNVDWYVAAVPGGSPARSEARGVLLREGFQAVQGLPFPDAWVRAGNRILFHGNVGDSSNIWHVEISPEHRHISGTPQRATFGTTDEAAASVTSDGRMVFISRTMGADIWSLAIDANRARVEGALERVTQDAADDYDPTLSGDGATLVYRSRRAGKFGVIMKRLGTSAETVLTRMPEDHYPAVSHDGTRVAYSFRNNGRMPIFVVAASGGTPDPVCDDCGAVEEWSADNSRILYATAHDPSGVGLLQVGSSHDDGWLRHPGYGIYNPRLSSDSGWIAFNGRTNRFAPAQLFVAKVETSGVAPEKDWIVIATDADAPAWSPDASLLYFWSDRDGSPCVWAQRLDPATKRPTGEPLSVQHFHNRGLSWKNLYLGAPDIAVARDKLVFNLGEHTGNIWMTQLSQAPE